MDPIISGLIFSAIKYAVSVLAGMISYHFWWKSRQAEIEKVNAKLKADLENAKTKQEQEDATKHLADHGI